MYSIEGNLWMKNSVISKKYITDMLRYGSLEVSYTKATWYNKILLPGATSPLAFTIPSGSITATNSSAAKVLKQQ